MQGFRRYAIYALPAPAPLAQALAAWLGWDIATGQPVAQPVIKGHNLPALTAVPRRYGAHGTLKPPFALASDRTVQELDTALSTFCARTEAVTLNGLQVAPLRGFLALVPIGDTQALNRMAAAVLSAMDGFRGPQSPAQLARRRAAGLNAREEALLLRWGYPYVMETFRFHITLTGPVDTAEGKALRKLLQHRLTPLLPRPFIVDHLCLVGEDDAGLFHLIRRYPLSGDGAG